MIDNGDEYAKLVFETMAYQIAKEVGALATTVNGRVDAIALTGGIVYSKRMADWITDRVSFIAPVIPLSGRRRDPGSLRRRYACGKRGRRS